VSGYQSLTENGVTREYILQLPSGYDPASSTPLPLIINFHGNGGCAGSFSQGASDLTALANSHNVIVAYPQGISRVKGAAEWDPSAGGGSDLTNNDMYFSQQLIAEISANHAIDATRIYATGYSNGGMMAYGLACSLGNQIAAVGIMSGIMLDSQCDASNYTPVIHFHGTADGALPYAGNQDFRSVADVISFWVNHNQISPTEPTTTQLNGGRVRLDSYTGGAEDSAVMLYTLQDGGHVWFDEDIGGESPNQILWGFLSGYSLDGAI
jgi:polyhydroxybutyrate depolymerase